MSCDWSKITHYEWFIWFQTTKLPLGLRGNQPQEHWVEVDTWKLSKEKHKNWCLIYKMVLARVIYVPFMPN
jgi:hypothetical protein